MGVAVSVTSTHSPEADEMSQSLTSSRPRDASRHERPDEPVWRSVRFSMRANGAVECTVWFRLDVIVTPDAPTPTDAQPISITGTSILSDSR